MKAIIAADELAKDVAGAEALLERHQEHRVCLFNILRLELISFCADKLSRNDRNLPIHNELDFNLLFRFAVK